MDILAHVNYNNLEKEIISTLEDIIYEYPEVGDLSVVSGLSDEQLVRLIFDTYLQQNWECDSFLLHETPKRLKEYPGDPVIPVDLFVSAMEFALGCVRWNLISSQSKIQKQINELRSKA